MAESIFTNSYNIGFILLSMLLFAVFGYYFETGIHPWLMTLAGVLIGGIAFILFKKLFHFIGPIFSKIPNNLILSVLAFVTTLFLAKFLGFRFPDALFYLSCGLAILLVILFHYSFQTFRKRGLSISSLGLFVPIILLALGIWWMLQSGQDPFSVEDSVEKIERNVKTLSSMNLENPASVGTYQISSFTYGSNNDKHRNEYNQDARYITQTVDASILLPEWTGDKKKWRERYWGFGVKNFPINGRVHMPDGAGPFAISLIVHGNHGMIDYSDNGYNYLTETLASKGIIGVSVDENFINGHWSGDFRGKEMPTRAWLLLKHLQQWQSWNKNPHHELYQKIDLSRVMLIGHSRGGEAVSIATVFNKLPYFPDNALEKFDFNFGIKGVVSIAPTDYRYQRQVDLKNVNYLSLQGSYDSDEVSFWGMRPYERLQFTDGQDYFKAGVYIHRANHGQFNTTWGSRDFGPPTGWLLNTKPMLSPDAQQSAAKLFISAFVESVLLDNKSYLPIFQNADYASDWLPVSDYLTHYRDSDDVIIQDFEEDIDVGHGKNAILIKAQNLKIWREENLTARDKGSQENNVVLLGWDYGEKNNHDTLASYTLILPDSTKLKIDTITHLLLDIAAADIKALDKLNPKEEEDYDDVDDDDDDKKRDYPELDFTIELIDQDGNVVSTSIRKTKRISVPLKSRFTKLKSLDQDMIGDESEVQLESFAIHISKSNQQAQNFDCTKLREIKFIFDQCPYGVVAIDNIGFSSN